MVHKHIRILPSLEANPFSQPLKPLRDVSQFCSFYFSGTFPSLERKEKRAARVEKIMETNVQVEP